MALKCLDGQTRGAGGLEESGEGGGYVGDIEDLDGAF